MIWPNSQIPNRGWSKRPTAQAESSIGQSRLIPSTREVFLTTVAKWQRKFSKKVGVKPCFTRSKPGPAFKRVRVLDQIWKNLRGERNPTVVFKAFLGFRRRKIDSKILNNELRQSVVERWEKKEALALKKVKPPEVNLLQVKIDICNKALNMVIDELPEISREFYFAMIQRHYCNGMNEIVLSKFLREEMLEDD